MYNTDSQHSSAGNLKKVVVIGGGFAGLNFVKNINPDYYDVTVIDRNNYHCFPPLFYQVASAGLDPASICFPLRRELRKRKSLNIRFHMGEVKRIDFQQRRVSTADEEVPYDILIIAAGTTNNFFNMPQLEKTVYTLKSTAESLRARNDILDILERASLERDMERQRRMLNFVVIGGGPTGVEMAGAIGEMKRYVLPREYPSIPQENMNITLIEGAPRLLGTMSEKSSAEALSGLTSLMVDVKLGMQMKGYDDHKVQLADGSEIDATLLIWTAGVTGVPFDLQGTTSQPTGRGNRFLVDETWQVIGYPGVYALGDISLMTADPAFPNGHPQLAQVAIQGGRLVAANLNTLHLWEQRAAANPALRAKGPKLKPFRYNDKGSMATIGRNRAVVDMKKAHLAGFWAWMAWMFVHLVSLLGMRNKITVLVNWIWAYFNYSTSLRLLIHPAKYPLRKRWEDPHP